MIPGATHNHPNFRRSFFFALQGLRTAILTERNIKVMLVAAAVVIAFGFTLNLDLVSWGIILLCCGMVITAELFNTAIETVVDLVSPEFHPLAGRAKDISAAAVWILSITAAIVGLLVFINAVIG